MKPMVNLDTNLKTTILTIGLVVVLASIPALADVEVVTPDGKRVLLKDDRTWEYVQSGEATSEEPEERHAELALIRRFDYDDACRLGFKLRNKLPYEIRNIVFRFSAFIEPSVVYQDVSRSFDNIRTSKSQYKEIIFRGVSCQNIHHVKVHGADHCIMGHLTKWSEEEGECLSLVDFMPTQLISISK